MAKIDKEYNRSKTAITRKGLSAPMRCLVDNDYLSKNDTILDFGCGRGSDCKLLHDEGYNISGYDEYNKQFTNAHLLEGRLDIVTCHYVFNVISCLDEHKQLMDDLKALSDDIYISVRKDKKAIRDNWIYIPATIKYGAFSFLQYLCTRG